MRKFIFGLLGMLLFTGSVYAANPLYAQIAAPQSPTNQTNLSINVVVLDQNQVPSISVQCYYRKNGGSWSSLGGAINVIPGGNNTANCQTSSSQLNENATYDFYATASDGVNPTATTQTVSVTLDQSAPGTPTNYSKTKNSCTYTISFRTADDGGKTVKVEIYRSTDTTFTADNGTKVGQVSIGSNQDGSYNDNVPNCGTNYYYAIRAFNSAGTGSDVVGDSQTETIYTSPTPGGTVGAIPAGTNGNILGASTKTSQGATGASGGVLGEATPSGSPTPTEAMSPTPTPKAGGIFTGRNVGIGGGILLVILFLVWLFK